MNREKIILYGTSDNYSVSALRLLGAERVLFFVEDDESKCGMKYVNTKKTVHNKDNENCVMRHGKWCYKKPVISLREFANDYDKKYKDCVIYITIQGKYKMEMARQLESYGIKNYFHYWIPQMGWNGYQLKSFFVGNNIYESKSIALYGVTQFTEDIIEFLDKMDLSDRILCIADSSDSSFVGRVFYGYEVKSIEDTIEDVDVLILCVPVFFDNIREELEDGLYKFSGKVLDACYNVDAFIPQNYNHEIKRFKSIHKNKRCFIIGNGPSLRIEDLNQLHDRGEICFGVNKIYMLFDQTEWRPDYYFVEDYFVIQQKYKTIRDLPLKNKFIYDFDKSTPLPFMENCIRINSKILHHYPNMASFSKDPSLMVICGHTVTYTEIQFAAYMGFSEIYLLGIDFSYSSDVRDKGNHFSNAYFDKKAEEAAPFYEGAQIKAYEKAEKHSRKNGFRIYNATRGGKLEVFERVDFDMLMNTNQIGEENDA